MADDFVGFEYAGHKVELTEDFRFEVSGPAFPSENRNNKFETAAAARDAVERRIKASARQREAQERISIPAVDDNGNPCVIRGINANTGDLLGATKKDRGVSDVYPPEPWLIEGIKRLRRLEDEFKNLRDKIREYEISGSRGYGRIEAHEYDGKIERLKGEFARKAALAKEREPKPGSEQ